MILKKIKYFIFLDMKTKLLLFEAFIFLGGARILIAFPFSKISPLLGVQMEETAININPNNEKILKNIRHAISIMSNYTFWDSKCIVKAIAGMKMLERRHIESTIYFGIAKDDKGKMIAHAWLRSGPLYITGAEELRRFNEVSKFAKKLFA
jgi:hypothetical protein